MDELQIRRSQNGFMVREGSYNDGLVGKMWVAETIDKLVEVIRKLCDESPNAQLLDKETQG